MGEGEQWNVQFPRKLLSHVQSHPTHLHLSLPFMPQSLLSLNLGHFSNGLGAKLLSTFWDPSPMSLLWSFLWYLPPKQKGPSFLEPETTCHTACRHTARHVASHTLACHGGQLWVPRGQRSRLISPGRRSSWYIEMVKKCLLDGSTKMEGDFSEKMRPAVLHSKEKEKGNGHKLHHGKLQLDKNSLSEREY